MITLTPTQQDLAGRATIAPLGLVTITTYTDRDAQTEQSVFRFATATVLYDYGTTGTAQTFHGLIRDLEVPERSMPGVPTAVPTFVADAMSFSIVNDKIDGVRVWTLLSAANLSGATIEASTLLLQPGRFAGYVGEGNWWDLRGLAGDEHIVRFRGELSSVGAVTEDSIEMEFVSITPEVPWVEALDPDKNSPRDFGKRLPIVVGAAQRVPCLNYDVGALTTLAEEITADQTGQVQVTSTVGFTGSFDAQISGERVKAIVVDETLINITARGDSGTKKTVHSASETVIEIPPTATFALAAHPISRLRALYAVSLYTGLLTRVTTPFTTTLADSATIPGKTIASVMFTESQIQQLLEQQAAAAEVTQQPAFDSPNLYRTFRWSGRAALDDAQLYPPGPGLGLSSTENESTVSANQPSVSLVGNQQAKKAAVFWIPDGNASPDVLASTVVRFRALVNFDAKASSNASLGAYYNTNFGGISAGGQYYSMPSLPNVQIDYGVVVGTDWKFPSFGSNQVQDFINTTGSPSTSGPRIMFYMRSATNGTPDTSNGMDIYSLSGGIEMEIAGIGLQQVQQTEIAAASLGANLQFYADMDGAAESVDQGPPVTLYNWDTDLEGWQMDPLTAHATLGNGVPPGGAYSGPSSLELLVQSSDVQFDSLDTLDANGLWFGLNSTVSIETINPYEGTGYLHSISDGTDQYARARNDSIGNLDWTGKKFRIAFRVPAAVHGDLNPSDAIRVAIGSDPNLVTDYIVLNRDASFIPLPDVWTVIDFDIDETPDATQGTFNPASVSTLQLLYGFNTAVAGQRGDFDDWVLYDDPDTEFRQVVTTPETDFTSTRIEFRVYFDLSTFSRVTSFFFDIGDNSKQDYFTAAIPLAELTPGWNTVAVLTENMFKAVGTPDMTRIFFMGFRVYSGPNVFEPGDVWWIDQLDVTPVASVLADDPAAVVTWFLTDYCGLSPSVIDPVSFAEAETNLANVKLAGNLTGAGSDFESVLSRMGFETRSNIIRDEAASGPVFRMLTAKAPDYTYGAAAAAVTEWSQLQEDRIPRPNLGNVYRGYYAVDASQGDSEEAYGSLVRVDSTVSDSGVPTTTEMAEAAQRFGTLERGPYYFRLIQDEVSAEDVFGFYPNQGIRDGARIFEATIPHWEGFAFQRGDIITLNPTWGPPAAKLRILSIRHQLSGPDIRIVALEVE